MLRIPEDPGNLSVTTQKMVMSIPTQIYFSALSTEERWIHSR